MTSSVIYYDKLPESDLSSLDLINGLASVLADFLIDPESSTETINFEFRIPGEFRGQYTIN